jgi:hypothetical protein
MMRILRKFILDDVWSGMDGRGGNYVDKGSYVLFWAHDVEHEDFLRGTSSTSYPENI